MATKDYVVGLDIGTTKVCAIVGELDANDEVNIIGVGTSPSFGLRRGIVVDIEKTVKAVNTAIQKAERMSGVSISSVYLGIAGGHISSLNNRGVVAVTREDREISPEDVDRVIQAAKVINLPADRKIIHVLPRQFIVDGYDGINDPVGMSGVRLEVDAHIVTGAVTSIQNVVKSVIRAGVGVEDIVLQPLASGEAVLLPAERELGVILVDMGGGTTDLAIYDQGELWYTKILPIGGNYVTNDLAVGLRIPLTAAERIKIEYGCTFSGQSGSNETINIPTMGNKEVRQITSEMVARIIEPRMQEIFSLLHQIIKDSGYHGLAPGGVVLTGGASLLTGVDSLAMQELDLPVRIGLPINIRGMVDIVNSPVYATAVGLVRFGGMMRRSRQPVEMKREEKSLGSFMQIFSGWLKEFF